eukprot:COSAG01_NODE_64808_length_275_cov_0.676136_1_plen_21_part_10
MSDMQKELARVQAVVASAESE